MFEGLITSFLEGYINDYLEDFDKSNMIIDFYRGVVHLKDITLKNKILDNLNFPVKMKYGKIGLIEIRIPSFINITNSKITVKFSEIFLCLS